jgi:hypothetical protein
MADNFFIADDIFELQSLTGFQGLGMHAAESGLLRAELSRAVAASYSPENWAFIQKIYAINQQKQEDKAELQSQLMALAATYIVGPKDQLNLSEQDKHDVLKKMSSKDFSAHDFLPVVNEVFSALIIKNLTQDDIEIFRQAEQLINATSKIAQQISILQRDTKPEHTVSFFNRSTQADETRTYVEVNVAAQKAQKELYQLLNEPKITLKGYKVQFASIMDDFNTQMETAKTKLNALSGANEQRMKKFEISLTAIAKTQQATLDPGLSRSAFTMKRT